MRYSALSLSCAATVAASIAASVASTAHFETSPITPLRNAIQVTSEVSLVSTETVQSFQILLERPLFSSTRRPFVQAKELATDTPMESEIEPETVEVIEEAPPQIHLFGVAEMAGRPIALISEGDQSQAQWFGSGDKVGTWTLITVDRDTIAIAPTPESAQRTTISMSNISVPQEVQHLE